VLPTQVGRLTVRNHSRELSFSRCEVHLAVGIDTESGSALWRLLDAACSITSTSRAVAAHQRPGTSIGSDVAFSRRARYTNGTAAAVTAALTT